MWHYRTHKKKYLRLIGVQAGGANVIDTLPWMKLKSHWSIESTADPHAFNLKTSTFELPMPPYVDNLDLSAYEKVGSHGFGDAVFFQNDNDMLKINMKIGLQINDEYDHIVALSFLTEIALHYASYTNGLTHDRVVPVLNWFTVFSKNTGKYFVGYTMRRMDGSVMTSEKDGTYKLPVSDVDIGRIKSGIEFLRKLVPDLATIGIVHGDLHLGNVLYKNSMYYVADFGRSEYIDHASRAKYEKLDQLTERIMDVNSIDINESKWGQSDVGVVSE